MRGSARSELIYESEHGDEKVTSETPRVAVTLRVERDIVLLSARDLHNLFAFDRALDEQRLVLSLEQDPRARNVLPGPAVPEDALLGRTDGKDLAVLGQEQRVRDAGASLDEPVAAGEVAAFYALERRDVLLLGASALQSQKRRRKRAVSPRVPSRAHVSCRLTCPDTFQPADQASP